MDTLPLRICGWMRFKHQVSGERLSAPAIATFTERGVSWGERTRMALSLRAPLTDAAGPWEVVRHDAWSRGVIDEAKLWVPMGFITNNPGIQQALLTQSGSLLRSNPSETRKNLPPERRVPVCRFDEWLKGWSVDLVWDPFKDLAPSALVLSQLAREGLIPIEGDEVYERWLSQPVVRAPAREPSNAAQQSGPPMESSHEAPQAAAISSSPAVSPNASAPPAPIPGFHASSAPSPMPVFSPAGATNASADEPVPGFHASSAPSPMPVFSPAGATNASADEPNPFDPPIEPAATATRAAVALPEPSPPVAILESPASQPPATSQKTPMPPRQALSSEAPLDRDQIEALALSIFGGPDLPDFSTIARAAGGGLRVNAPDHRQAPLALGVQADEPRAQAPKLPVDLRFARFPRHNDSGAIFFETTLLSCSGYMEREVFDVAKRQKRGERPGVRTARESLYGLGLLSEMAREGIAFELEGQAPDPKFITSLDGRACLDVENFTLSALSKSTTPNAANIAHLARASFYRHRIFDLLDQAARVPLSEPAGHDGWIQISAGPPDPSATCVHPDTGAVRWMGPESGLLNARLSAPEERDKLFKLCELLRQAVLKCSPAQTTPEAHLPPGGAPIDGPEPRAGLALGRAGPGPKP